MYSISMEQVHTYNNVVSVDEVWRHTVVDCSDWQMNTNNSNDTDDDRKKDEFLRKRSWNFLLNVSLDLLNEVLDKN